MFTKPCDGLSKTNYNLNAQSFGGHRKGRGGNPKGLFGRSPGFPLSL